MDERTKQMLALGTEHFHKRDFEKAEYYLSKVLERPEKFADVLHMMGIIHYDRGRFLDAQASFEEALVANPHYTEAALSLAVTYNELGRYEDARRIYEAALSRNAQGSVDPFIKGKIANLHAQVAAAYVDAGMVSEAIHELRKAVLLCPNFADLRVKLANLYTQKGDLAAARFELEEGIAVRSSYVPAHIALGVTWLSLGDTEQAIRAWERALEFDPENASAKMYLRSVRVS